MEFDKNITGRANTPEEMRAEIFKSSHRDPFIRTACYYADIRGMNAEDRYTILACHALVAKMSVEEQLWNYIKNSKVPTLFLEEK